MKSTRNPLRPSWLWFARHFACSAALKLAKWRTTGLQAVDQKKFLAFTTYCSKRIIIVGAAALTLVALPCATISVLGSIEAEWTGKSSNFGFNYRSIEMSPINVKSWQIVASNVKDEEDQRRIQRYWSQAVEHANGTHTKIAMVKSDTVDLLQESILRNRANPRELMIGALVEVLSTGGSETQALEKARRVLNLGEQATGTESFLMSQFGPVKSCIGMPLFKTLIAPLGDEFGPTWAVHRHNFGK